LLMSTGGVMGEAVPLCPFCGAPYRETIMPNLGSTRVICERCGCLFLLPPSFGGVEEHCANHPDKVAVGICEECGRPFCKSCLRVVRESDRRVTICPNCLPRFRAEEIRVRAASKQRIIAAIILAALIVGSMIAYRMYTYSIPVGSALRNWPPAKHMNGINIIVTLEDPRKMSIGNLTEYISNKGCPDDFISVVIAVHNIAHIRFKGARIQPYTRRITIKVVTYTCGRASSFSAGAAATPHKEVLTVFLGRLQPGYYLITVEIFDGGTISWIYRDGKLYPVYEYPYKEVRIGTEMKGLRIG